MRVYTLLQKIFYKIDLIQDYIVDSGIRDIWEYKIYNSGTVVCIGRRNLKQSFTFVPWASSVTSTYYCFVDAVNYPFTFDSIPMEIQSCPTQFGSWWHTNLNNSTTKTGRTMLLRPTTLTGTIETTLQYIVIGTIKSESIMHRKYFERRCTA